MKKLSLALMSFSAFSYLNSRMVFVEESALSQHSSVLNQMTRSLQDDEFKAQKELASIQQKMSQKQQEYQLTGNQLKFEKDTVSLKRDAEDIQLKFKEKQQDTMQKLSLFKAKAEEEYLKENDSVDAIQSVISEKANNLKISKKANITEDIASKIDAIAEKDDTLKLAKKSDSNSSDSQIIVAQNDSSQENDDQDSKPKTKTVSLKDLIGKKTEGHTTITV